MKKVSFKEAKEFINGDKCHTYEYGFNNKELGIAKSIISGRYPECGYCVNEECLELIYVLSGNGALVKENEKIEFSMGDALMIDRGEKFYWDGECEVLAMCAPAWFSSQHKEVK